jgi:hypothetical protein
VKQTKNVANGFVAMASVICLFVTFIKLLFYWTLWVGLPLLLVLAVPFFAACGMRVKKFEEQTPIQTRVKQAKSFLMGVHGVGLACWFFDVLSTIFNININQNGTELNPLGWPYSAPAALAYYVPITFVVYYLLFKVKSKASFYGAVVVSFLSLFMAARNLGASLYNFTGLRSASATADLQILLIWGAITVVLAALNLNAFLKIRNKQNCY